MEVLTYISCMDPCFVFAFQVGLDTGLDSVGCGWTVAWKATVRYTCIKALDRCWICYQLLVDCSRAVLVFSAVPTVNYTPFHLLQMLGQFKEFYASYCHQLSKVDADACLFGFGAHTKGDPFRLVMDLGHGWCDPHDEGGVVTKVWRKNNCKIRG